MTTRFEIAGRPVGRGEPTYVIAEIGSNHDGRMERAFELVDAAARAGADAVKFQSFTAAGLCHPAEPAFPILERIALPTPWYPELWARARDDRVHFLSTPFDEAQAQLLFDLGVPAFKIASGDLTHLPLLRSVARHRRPMIVSTGLATAGEVEHALSAIREVSDAPVALLHCVASYPPAFGELNLRAVVTMAERFGTVVGLSDHTPGHSAVLAAVALGASVIEKHVTFDRSLPGPDHSYALTFEELAALVQDVRRVEAALGDGSKSPAPSEPGGRVAGRRSLYACRDIPRGTTITREMIAIVRPARGLCPADLDRIVGQRAARDIAKDELLTWQDLAP